MQQRTLAKTVSLSGIGLHSGCQVNLKLNPAPAGSGIVFRRTDLPGQPQLAALYSNVTDTRNCTCLGDGKGLAVSTIEHLMAALAVSAVDNALIDVDNQEMPIMDGSALPFYQAIQDAGTTAQNAPRQVLKVLREVSFSDDKGNSASLSPSSEFAVDFEIEFPSKIVGCQRFNHIITPKVFAELVAPCRTFCEKYQVDYLQSVGLIKGGSLENAVVLDGETILNPGGFRVENECVNHKVIDAIGDMYTAGLPLIGRLKASKSGHYHNNMLLKQLFADPANFEIIEG